MFLYQIKECKYKYPYQIHKVPVESNFFYHLIVASAFVSTENHVKENDNVDHHPGKYVESVKTCYKEKEIGK